MSHPHIIKHYWQLHSQGGMIYKLGHTQKMANNLCQFQNPSLTPESKRNSKRRMRGWQEKTSMEVHIS